ncbi:hypothetical protein D5H75_12450 [Bailinhaonella thermotolerans]|uniref:Uncharacterized protein n=1 Tax=Bailinhaonella thermotolerans TaxID=1070861 RepID=A0A3A4AVC4_9ACTN|nr:hypothetical protein D5H75_12450 [Bailinhaonella thermotolerans]
MAPPRMAPPRVAPPRVAPPRVAPPRVVPPRVVPPRRDHAVLRTRCDQNCMITAKGGSREGWP